MGGWSGRVCKPDHPVSQCCPAVILLCDYSHTYLEHCLTWSLMLPVGLIKQCLVQCLQNACYALTVQRDIINNILDCVAVPPLHAGAP